MGASRTKVPDISELKVINTANEIKKSANKEKALKELFEKMTEKEARLVVQILTRRGDETMVEMCRRAGYKVDGKNKMSSVKKSISGKLEKVFYELGYTLADLVHLGQQLTKATKVQVVKMNKYDDEGKVTGQEIHLVEVPDWPTRQKQWKMLMEHGNHFQAKELNMKKSTKHEITYDLPDAKLAEIRKRTESAQLKPDFEVIEDATIN